MNSSLDITLLEPHARSLQGSLVGKHEAAAYVLFGRSSIDCDLWNEGPRLRLVSHKTVPVADGDRISASELHVTWSTRGFMRILSMAKEAGLVPGIVHTHPGSHAFFSPQDDANEAELARTAANKGTMGLASIVLGGDGSICGRLWGSSGEPTAASFVQVVGGRLLRWNNGATLTADADHLERQSRLFGAGFNPLIRTLKIAIVGLGGTGSALAMLLTRLGVGCLLLIDNDVIEFTNLNRVHGARREDAKTRTTKVEVARREIEAADLGVRVAIHRGWVSDESIRDSLKSCDFVFGCTDDHGGRILLNRLAYFYGLPVIDIGLRMAPWQEGNGHDINGRVTTLFPGRPCLLCGKVVNTKRAAEEFLQRVDPTEFEKRKKEAYVIGSGDPAPAVVTFTTEIACVAVNELIAALTGFHGHDGMVPTRYRRFHARDDRFLARAIQADCPICSNQQYWGRADVDPFLDMIGG